MKTTKQYEVRFFLEGEASYVSILETNDRDEAYAFARERQQRRRRNLVTVVDREAK